MECELSDDYLQPFRQQQWYRALHGSAVAPLLQEFFTDTAYWTYQNPAITTDAVMQSLISKYSALCDLKKLDFLICFSYITFHEYPQMRPALESIADVMFQGIDEYVDRVVRESRLLILNFNRGDEIMMMKTKHIKYICDNAPLMSTMPKVYVNAMRKLRNKLYELFERLSVEREQERAIGGIEDDENSSFENNSYEFTEPLEPMKKTERNINKPFVNFVDDKITNVEPQYTTKTYPNPSIVQPPTMTKPTSQIPSSHITPKKQQELVTMAKIHEIIARERNRYNADISAKLSYPCLDEQGMGGQSFDLLHPKGPVKTRKQTRKRDHSNEPQKRRTRPEAKKQKQQKEPEISIIESTTQKTSSYPPNAGNFPTIVRLTDGRRAIMHPNPKLKMQKQLNKERNLMVIQPNHINTVQNGQIEKTQPHQLQNSNQPPTKFCHWRLKSVNGQSFSEHPENEVQNVSPQTSPIKPIMGKVVLCKPKNPPKRFRTTPRVTTLALTDEVIQTTNTRGRKIILRKCFNQYGEPVLRAVPGDNDRRPVVRNMKYSVLPKSPKPIQYMNSTEIVNQVNSVHMANPEQNKVLMANSFVRGYECGPDNMEYPENFIAELHQIDPVQQVAHEEVVECAEQQHHYQQQQKQQQEPQQDFQFEEIPEPLQVHQLSTKSIIDQAFEMSMYPEEEWESAQEEQVVGCEQVQDNEDLLFEELRDQEQFFTEEEMGNMFMQDNFEPQQFDDVSEEEYAHLEAEFPDLFVHGDIDMECKRRMALFMLGRLENPNPLEGDAFSIKVSETTEPVIIDNFEATQTTELYFEMNFTTLEWKTIQKTNTFQNEGVLEYIDNSEGINNMSMAYDVNNYSVDGSEAYNFSY